MEQTYVVLTPPLVTGVDTQDEVSVQNKALKEHGATMVPRADLEASGHSDLPRGQRIWAVKSDASPEAIAFLTELAGPQHRETRDAKFATLDEQKQNKAPVQEAAAAKVGKSTKDPRSAALAEIRETGIAMYVMVSEVGSFKQMLKDGGAEGMHAYVGATGEQKVAADLPEKMPELFKSLQERFGEHRREEWAAQPEVIAKGEQAAKQGEAKRTVRATAASYVSFLANPEPLRVVGTDKGKELIARELPKLKSDQIAIKLYEGERTLARYAAQHQRSEAFEKAAGYSTVSATAKEQHDITMRGVVFARAELAARGFEYPYDAAKGIGPSKAEIEAAFPGHKAAKSSERSASKPASEATKAADPGKQASKPKQRVAGGSRKKPAGAAR